MAACEPVDDGAATRAQGWDMVLTNHVLPHDREVFNTIEEDPMDVSADGCEKTASDAHQILQDNCASCHDEGSPAQTPVTFNFIMDDDKMKAQTWAPPGGSVALRYISVGNADASAIFMRAVTARDMPPIAVGFDDLLLPRLTYSAASVLRQWIDVCM